MVKVKPCPGCGHLDFEIRTGSFTGDRFVVCLACGYRGPYKETADKAVRGWNKEYTEKDAAESKRGKGK